MSQALRLDTIIRHRKGCRIRWMSDARTNVSFCRRRLPFFTPSPRTLYVYSFLIHRLCLSHHKAHIAIPRGMDQRDIFGLGKSIRPAIEYESQSKSRSLRPGVIVFASQCSSFFFCQISCARERFEFRTTLVSGRCYDYLLTNRNDLCLKASTSLILVLKKGETDQQ